jgi:hypothetical protein
MEDLIHKTVEPDKGAEGGDLGGDCIEAVGDTVAEFLRVEHAEKGGFRREGKRGNEG